MPRIPLSRWLASLAFIASAFLCARTLAAQGARPDLTAFRDTLAALSTRGELDARLAAEREANAAGRAARETREGWLRLRAAVLGRDRAELARAIGAFDEATVHDPRWPDPRYGLARAELAVEAIGGPALPGRHHAAGMSPRDAALHDLAQALLRQPAYAPAVALLDSLLEPAEAPVLADDVQAAIAAAAGVGGAPAAIHLLHGRALRAAGEHARAREAFARYLADGGNGAVGRLEAARVLRMLDRSTEAVRSYLDGADAIRDSVGRARYRRDMSLVASPEEMVAFDRLPADSLGPWIAGFWRSRDADAMRTEGERLAEHLRRWIVAHAEYRRLGRSMSRALALRMRGQVPDAESEESIAIDLAQRQISDGDSILSDQGRVYMRYGAPARFGGGDSSVSWQYDLPTGPLAFHFISGGSHLIPMPSMADISRVTFLGTEYVMLESQIVGAAIWNDFSAWASTLSARANGGRATLGGSSGARSPITTRVKLMAQRNVATYRTALREDAFPQTYKRALDPTVQVYALGPGAASADTAGRILVVFAIPGRQLRPVEQDGRTTYPVRIRVTLADSARRGLRQLDTLRTFAVPKALGKGAYLQGVLDLPAPPGTYHVGALFVEPDRDAAGAAGRGGVEVVRAGDSLAISDLVLGSADPSLVWRRGGRAVPLNALAVFRRDEAAQLYYELYGLVPGREYAVAMEVARAERDRPSATDRLDLSFTEQAAAATVPVTRTLGFRTLRPGRYLLTVRVRETASGRSAVRQAVLHVR